MVDLNGDGQPQLISHWEGRWGWLEPNPQQPRRPWRFQPLAEPTDPPEFYHGQGVGDVNGDGHRDIVTGKRRWAHGPTGDIEPDAPPVVYWFQYTRDERDQVRFVPHQIDDRSGVGVQVQAVDVNGDGRTDVLTASKLGSFLFLNLGAASP